MLVVVVTFIIFFFIFLITAFLTGNTSSTGPCKYILYMYLQYINKICGLNLIHSFRFQKLNSFRFPFKCIQKNYLKAPFVLQIFSWNLSGFYADNTN